jgi:hypothetical protein
MKAAHKPGDGAKAGVPRSDCQVIDEALGSELNRDQTLKERKTKTMASRVESLGRERASIIIIIKGVVRDEPPISHQVGRSMCGSAKTCRFSSLVKDIPPLPLNQEAQQ